MGAILLFQRPPMAVPQQRSKEYARLEMPLWSSAEGLLHVVVVVVVVAIVAWHVE